MRRISAVVLLALAFLLSSFSLTSATAVGTAGNGETLTLISKSVSFESIDVGDEGPSVGDYDVFSDDVYKKGEKVGTLDGTCVVTRWDEADKSLHLHCVVTVILEGGQITHQGAVVVDQDFADKVTVAVTGGTGDYLGASGETHVTFLSETRSRLRIELE